MVTFKLNGLTSFRNSYNAIVLLICLLTVTAVIQSTNLLTELSSFDDVFSAHCASTSGGVVY